MAICCNGSYRNAGSHHYGSQQSQANDLGGCGYFWIWPFIFCGSYLAWGTRNWFANNSIGQRPQAPLNHSLARTVVLGGACLYSNQYLESRAGNGGQRNNPA